MRWLKEEFQILVHVLFVEVVLRLFFMLYSNAKKAWKLADFLKDKNKKSRIKIAEV